MTQVLAAADPVAVLLAWLRGHASVLAEFGDPARISGRNETPYPRLMVMPSPGGSDGDLRWILDGEVSLTTYGEFDGTPGQAALRRMHYTALGAAAELPMSRFTAGQPVVSAIRATTAAYWAPEPLTGQPAWRSTLLLTIHPPRQGA